MHKKWIFPSAVEEGDNNELAEFPRAVQQVLFNRGIFTSQDAYRFFDAQMIRYDPFLIKNMDLACDRIMNAIRSNENIAIYGDYDVDGVSATATLVEVIRRIGGIANGYIPNRYDEGYGLNIDALALLKSQGNNLVITVDCGARSFAEAVYCRQIGLDLIITDHHMPQGDLPEAVAVLNPKQNGDNYPFKELSGAGLAYKLAQALTTRFPELEIDADQWLDFTALGTVADVVPLVDENRGIVKRGMEMLKKTTRPGIQALKNVSGIVNDNFDSFTIGFLLAPRLNAAGRLESALEALELLLAKDIWKAGQLANRLDLQNKQRQELTRVIQERVMADITDDKLPYLLFAADEEFVQGVVGLAASRLVEKFYRPSIVASRGKSNTKGSCRSIAEFHITKALDECSDLLIRHGGHAMAAGFTVQNRNVTQLVERLQKIAKAQLETEELVPKLRIDAVVSMSEVNHSLMDWVERFQPTGSENPDPVFVVRNAKVIEKRTVGKEGLHLKIRVMDEHGMIMDAICFRMGGVLSQLHDYVDIAFNLEKDFFAGCRDGNGGRKYRLQMNARDIIPANP